MNSTSVKSTCKYLVISFTSDWRFPPERSKEIVDTLLTAQQQVSYLEVEADQGHDAFLLPIPRYIDALKSYLGCIAAELNKQVDEQGESADAG